MYLRTEGLTKIYGKGQNEVVALNNATITIGAGEFMSIVGPSGSGKSTLLHLLSGLDRPTKGRVFIGEKDLYALNEKDLSAFRRKSFGFIFQQFNLIPILTAEDNINMPILLDRKQPDKEYLKELSEMLEIKDRLIHLPHELSGGQQQRVAIARALIAKPDIIFADEPTGNLDSKSGSEVMKLLTSTSRQFGKTLIIITHDKKIAGLADRQLSIIDGMVQEVN
ncbi:ABC transporter ATP-binding protein [Alkaliphilus serpentinus]|uniref:ABC transporter ATP-binding protein n=1 Tax=Alkaliphilus serpentinus TaxID=1482731 RepID=A0A833HMF6_9FIRM|nr:ABC transporter ATP-binding protein [Alkaliphilus serpentinus]KAB3527449.1 ABC transporter ATP-binding protein [Alkaliphilus serpentinus]